MKITVIGAGNMGSAFVSQLARAGHQVSVTARDSGKAAQVAAANPGASQSIIASFQMRWMPSDIASFITSYFEATRLKTPCTIPAFSASGTSWNPKWVVFSSVIGLAVLGGL